MRMSLGWLVYRRFRVLIWVVAVAALAGCGLLATTPTSVPGAFETLVAQGVAATLTAAVPLPGLIPTTAATAPVVTVPTTLPVSTAGAAPTSAIPSSRFFTDARYELAEERLIGSYAIRVWRNTRPGADPAGFDRVATIAQTGAPPI